MTKQTETTPEAPAVDINALFAELRAQNEALTERLAGIEVAQKLASGGLQHAAAPRVPTITKTVAGNTRTDL